jgi:DNA-directed RNA polymerase subunit RPC12/RpoP
MIVNCACATSVEAKLSLDSGEVVCQSCGNVIEISSFMKNAMRANGDVVRDTKPKIPFGGMLSVCQKCGKEFSAELNKKTQKCHCPKCKTEFKISNMAKDRLIEYKIFVGESEKIIKQDESIQRDDEVGEVASARIENDSDSEIKDIFRDERDDKPKSINKNKEKAALAKGLSKRPVIKRQNIDSNGDRIGGNVVFHPEAEENDAQLAADLEGRVHTETKKSSKKVKNK